MSEMPPFSWLVNKDVLQFAMFGLEGAGKTTLLYKLRIPQWKRDEIKGDMARLKKPDNSGLCKDGAYHYELMSTVGMKYGIWEIPGNELMIQMWPMFYRYLRISCVFYVVDAHSPDWFNHEKIDSARHWMNFLLNEDELRIAAFVLILNIKELTSETAGRGGVLGWEEFESGSKALTQTEQAALEMLGVPEIMKMEPHKERFFTFSCNCTDFGRHEPKWEECLKVVHKVYHERGEGAFLGR